MDLLGSFTSIITRFKTKAPYEWKSRTSRASRASGLLFFVSDCGSKVELSLLRDSDSVSASSWNWITQTIHSMNSEPIETQQKWENFDWLARRSVKVKAAATFLYSSMLSRWVSCAMQRLRNTCHWLCRLSLCACPGTVQPRPVTTTSQNQFLHFFHFDGAHRKCSGMRRGWQTCLYSRAGRVSRLHQSVSFVLQLVDVPLVCQQGGLFEFLSMARNVSHVQKKKELDNWHGDNSSTSLVQSARLVGWRANFQFNSNNFIYQLGTSIVWEHQSSTQEQTTQQGKNILRAITSAFC